MPHSRIIGEFSSQAKFFPMGYKIHVYFFTHSQDFAQYRLRVAAHAASWRADTFGIDLENPHFDFISLCRALGVPTERCEKLGELKQLLSHALSLGGPFMIDVQVDGSFKD
jgi:hypothetical protein